MCVRVAGAENEPPLLRDMRDKREEKENLSSRSERLI